VQVPKALAQRVEIRHALATKGRNQPLYHVKTTAQRRMQAGRTGS
jgi:hypothetical protein